LRENPRVEEKVIQVPEYVPEMKPHSPNVPEYTPTSKVLLAERAAEKKGLDLSISLGNVHPVMEVAQRPKQIPLTPVSGTPLMDPRWKMPPKVEVHPIPMEVLSDLPNTRGKVGVIEFSTEKMFFYSGGVKFMRFLARCPGRDSFNLLVAPVKDCSEAAILRDHPEFSHYRPKPASRGMFPWVKDARDDQVVMMDGTYFLPNGCDQSALDLSI